MIVRLTPSARMEYQVRDPAYTTTEADLPSGTLSMPGYPHAGDEIEWEATGRHYTIQRVIWIVGPARPTADDEWDSEVSEMIAVLD